MEDHLEAASRKIQAAVRGYNVRKRHPLTHLRKIDAVRRSLQGLQWKAADQVYIERICVDVKECRKLTEGIMALVLELDALQDIHPVVRDIRKSVNREVVQFMEVIDAVVVGAPTSPWQDAKNNPNMGRSNSMSHMDPVFNHSLKRMHSLGNYNYPYQVHKRQYESRSEFEQNGEDAKRMHSLGNYNYPYQVHKRQYESRSEFEQNGEDADTMSLRGSSPSDGETGSVIGNSGQDWIVYQLEALRTETAAVIIQSTFRGFRVRRSRPLKHLRNIADVRAKLRELTVQVSSPNFYFKLRSDEMERRRVTESITALLLQLDSVQGVDQVLREIRKSITGEVFKLQELVDMLISSSDIVEGASAPSWNGTESEFHDVSENRSRDSPLDKRRTEGEKPAGEEVPIHSLSLNNTGHERLNDGIGLTTRDCDQQRNHVDLDDSYSHQSAEYDCQARELDRVQVRVPDRFLHSNETTSSLNEIAEGNESSDHESGPCAAVVSGNDSSSLGNDEHSVAVPAIMSKGLSQGKVEDFQVRNNPDNNEECPSSSVVGREQLGDSGKMVSAIQVEEENIKLRALLHQVLRFAELQSSRASKIMETNEKLEAEIARYKKREKRSKGIRRKR